MVLKKSLTPTLSRRERGKRGQGKINLKSY
jgi:hypothetical protein